MLLGSLSLQRHRRFAEGRRQAYGPLPTRSIELRQSNSRKATRRFAPTRRRHSVLPSYCEAIRLLKRGLPLAHFTSAAALLLAIPLSSRWKLQRRAKVDLTPSMNWPAPVVSDVVEGSDGPVLVTVEYRLTGETAANPLLRALRDFDTNVCAMALSRRAPSRIPRNAEGSQRRSNLTRGWNTCASTNGLLTPTRSCTKPFVRFWRQIRSSPTSSVPFSAFRARWIVQHRPGQQYNGLT